VLGLLKGLKSEALVDTLFEGIRDHRAKVRLGALTALTDYPEMGSVRRSVRQMLRGEADRDVRAKAQAILAMDPGPGEQAEKGRAPR
jgi:hypothetical protein